MTESIKPMDLESVIASAAGRADLAAQIYAASLVAIEVNTPLEIEYMQTLAAGLGLNAQTVRYIEGSLGYILPDKEHSRRGKRPIGAVPASSSKNATLNRRRRAR